MPIQISNPILPYPDQREIDTIKKTLSDLCVSFLNGDISEKAFGGHARALMHGNGSYNLSLLLKRAEVTCGQHICSFWNECQTTCQYHNGSILWEEDVSLFNKLEISKHQLHSRKKDIKNEENDISNHSTNDRIETLETKLKHAEEAIIKLQETITIEREERLKLTLKVENIEEKVCLLDQLHQTQCDLEEEETDKEYKLNPYFGAQITPFQSIPIIDLSLPLADIAANIGQACRQIGFFYIVNHGVSEDLMSQTFDFSRRFFDLPFDIKNKLACTNSKSGIRGFFRVGQEDLNGKDGTRDLETEDEGTFKSNQYKGDLKEGFDCGRDITLDEINLSCPMVDWNQWPEDEILPGFKHGILTYQNALLKVSETLMKAFAIGLGMDASYFVKRTQKPMATLRLLHYPPQMKAEESTGQIGCGAHTDYGCCTILNQDSIGGLQVRNSQKEWIEAPPVPGSFVINIGDMMSRWTNGMYASTVHRVVNLSGEERYSIPFFVNPDVGTMVECLSTCTNEDLPPQYASETSDQILMQRYIETFKHLKKTE